MLELFFSFFLGETDFFGVDDFDFSFLALDDGVDLRLLFLLLPFDDFSGVAGSSLFVAAIVVVSLAVETDDVDDDVPPLFAPGAAAVLEDLADCAAAGGAGAALAGLSAGA